MALARLGFRFLFLGQNGLHHVARLGDVREIDFRLNPLRAACRRAAAVPGGLGPTIKLSADLLRLMSLEGARVSLSLGQTKFRQYVKYLTALDFHLACEIVDSYLTHPPLFGICYPKPLVAHSYLVALAASASIIARIA
jgi:hypothetical protein